jgi:hypothetical protein
MINQEQCWSRIKLVPVLLLLIVCSPVYSQLWIRTFDGPAHWQDMYYAMALDPLGNVVATGFTQIIVAQETVPFLLTAKYDPDGNRQWLRVQDRGSGLAVACDRNGNIYVTSSCTEETGGLTIKYYPDGNIAWIRSDGFFFWGSDIITDRNGDIYVTGSVSDSLNPIVQYAVTVKYGSDGSLKWMRVDSTGDWTVAIGLDSLGNVYVAGDDSGPAYLVMKYSPDGRLLWRQGSNLRGYGMSIAVSPNGDVYVTGSLGSGSYDAIATVKYSSDGEEQWVRIYDGPGWDYGYPVVIDNEGNCYVAGASGTQPGPWPLFDFVTIKYSPAGEELWVRRYDGSGKDDFPFAITTDFEGNVYIGGWSQVPQDSINYKADYTLLKYDPSGNLLWEARYSGPDNLGGAIYSIAIDNNNYIYTAGQVFIGPRERYSYDACIIKYPPDGPGIAEVRAGRASAFFVLAPNPAVGYFSVTGAVGLKAVRLYDIAGKLVRVYQPVNAGSRFSLERIPAGVYLVKLQTPDREITRKLVVR